jgi:hypothetical protein
MARPDGALRSGYGRDRPEEDHHVPAACGGADDDKYERHCDITTNIATNIANIATNTAAIAALNAATYVNSINSRTGVDYAQRNERNHQQFKRHHPVAGVGITVWGG